MLKKMFIIAGMVILGVAVLSGVQAAAGEKETAKSLNQSLFWAISRGDLEMLASLRDKGANVNATLAQAGLDVEAVFGRALKNLFEKDQKLYDLLVQDKVLPLEEAKLFDSKGKLLLTSADLENWPALTWAVFLRSEDMVRILIKSGAYVNASDRDGVMPLHWAAWSGNYPIVKLLVENGAGPLIMDRKGRSPLDWALLNNQADIVRKLPRVPAKPDSDGDGVPDFLDRCPNTPKGAPVDERGCWVAAYAEFFDSGRATIKKKYYPHLMKTAQVLLTNPQISVELAGHSDSLGRPDKNTLLAQKRAEAVRDFLVKAGVECSRFMIKSYGPSQPIADNATASGRAKNRRVEVRIWESQVNASY